MMLLHMLTKTHCPIVDSTETIDIMRCHGKLNDTKITDSYLAIEKMKLSKCDLVFLSIFIRNFITIIR